MFQCGKCKKQFTSLAGFISHKQTQCGALQQQQQPQQQPQTLTLQQTQQSQLTLNTGPSAFGPAINISQPFSQSQAQLNGTISTVSSRFAKDPDKTGRGMIFISCMDLSIMVAQLWALFRPLP